MTHYIAIIEDGGTDAASGVWFPDLPGCYSGGDSLDEAMENAVEAVRVFLEALAQRNMSPPAARPLSALKADPEWASDIESYIVALVPAPRAAFRPAAE